MTCVKIIYRDVSPGARNTKLTSICYLYTYSIALPDLYFSFGWMANKYNKKQITNINPHLYRIPENIGRREHWWIQLFRLFEGEIFSEWTTDILLILNTVHVYMIYLAVALIWWFGKSHKYHHIQYTPFML